MLYKSVLYKKWPRNPSCPLKCLAKTLILDKEKLDREKLDKEKLDKEKLDREKLDKEKLDKEKERRKGGKEERRKL